MWAVTYIVSHSYCHVSMFEGVDMEAGISFLFIDLRLFAERARAFELCLVLVAVEKNESV